MLGFPMLTMPMLQTAVKVARIKGEQASDGWFGPLWQSSLRHLSEEDWPEAIRAFAEKNGPPDMCAAIEAPEMGRATAPMRAEYLLSWRNRAESFRLPVNPATPPEVTVGHNNFSFETAELGTFKAIGRRGLTGLSISSFFPARYMPYVVCAQDELKSPDAYVNMLQKWKDSNEPIRLIITGQLNMAFAIERFSWYQEHGTGHISYTLELEEYRFDNVPATKNEAPVVKETGLRERPRGEIISRTAMLLPNPVLRTVGVGLGQMVRLHDLKEQRKGKK